MLVIKHDDGRIAVHRLDRQNSVAEMRSSVCGLLQRPVVRSTLMKPYDAPGTMAIRAQLATHHTGPKPFRWSAPADTVIGKRQRGQRLLESLHEMDWTQPQPAPSYSS